MMSKNKHKRAPRPGDIVFNDPHLTKQDHGGLADINTIAKQYYSGALPYPENPPLNYGDISSIDFQRSRDILAAVNSGFETLPSAARDAFSYDPAKYLSWLENSSEAISERGHDRVLFDYVNPEPEAPEPEFAQNSEKAGATEPDAGTQEHS